MLDFVSRDEIKHNEENKENSVCYPLPTLTNNLIKANENTL